MRAYVVFLSKTGAFLQYRSITDVQNGLPQSGTIPE
ncbi:hypothetical protein BACCIP111895_04240 [Neobacillus rhizosphaerae]|uniref:Uncharacterized protein n=1 Tax=Neobacillus rhizosphaerae TaxID=2880965 RepID=A0ABM9EWI8_9BACI|nr:hypothetical protein BACCIP111895_04240 [Neobacillus rhizosphaerae]